MKKKISYYWQYGKCRPCYLWSKRLIWDIEIWTKKLLAKILNLSKPECDICHHTGGYWTQCRLWSVCGNAKLQKKYCWMQGFPK